MAIAVIGILSGIGISVLGMVRRQAQSIQCISNVRQVGLAQTAFSSEHAGLLPNLIQNIGGADEGMPWFGQLGPYLSLPDDANDWYLAVHPTLPTHGNSTAGTMPQTIRNLTRASNSAASMFRGCPAMRTDGLDYSSEWTPGYGFNGWLDLPNSTDCSRMYWLGGIPDPYHIVFSGWGSPRTFKLASIAHPASRILVGESTVYFYKEDPPGSGGIYAADFRRHGATSNYLFVDMHVAKLTGGLAVTGVVNPP